MVEIDGPADRFWHFALTVYPQPDARAAFLRLQDRDGADVPMLLWCLWCAAEGVGLSVKPMRAALAFSVNWRRDRVEPVRALRRAWKGASGQLPPQASEAARQALAKAEQTIERIQMDHLADMAHGTDEADAALANIRLYAAEAGLSFDTDDIDTITCSVSLPVR